MKIAELLREGKINEILGKDIVVFKPSIPDDVMVLLSKNLKKAILTKNYKIVYDMRNGNQAIMGNNDVDPFSLDFPILMDIGIMGNCKNNCAICYQGNVSQENMTLENYKLLMEQARGLVNEVALGGRGDPNLHPQFEEILKATIESWIIPNYTTSGINLTQEQVDITKDYCGASAVSMYNKDFTFNALKMFMDSKVKTNIHFVLTSKNLPIVLDLLDGKDIWNGKVDLDRLNAVIFLLFKPIGNALGKDDLRLSKEQMKVFVDKCRNCKTNFKVGIDACIGNSMYEQAELNSREKEVICSCESGRSSVYVGPDMLMSPCSFCKNDSMKVKIDNKSTIYDIWNNNKVFIENRNLLKKTPLVCAVGAF